ncbi:trimeric intracellular cation channel family protein [Blastopirellula marina]|uniref:Trimeric intracellular cation channel family protein n=1 Tax=Blastopirellula marina TaxID=124 RepID=A0A2S8GHI2_9BACT|nr:trimeric intracellular cation channel family protein [Blastopirellula marina]PQO43908.1 trimeric intracellular cation channel family protein [Blastopirellula marina]
MIGPNESLNLSILVMMYFGDVVFAVSGALTAGRFRMDILGYLMVGTVTGIGGGTIRDLLLGRIVWWTQDPTELIVCVLASLITFCFIRRDVSHRKEMIWADALGLSVFGVVGCHISLQFGAPFVVAVFMGMITATGGGVIRDILTNHVPMIISSGQPYATVALLGSLCYATLRYAGLPLVPAEIIACLAAFSLRACAIIFDIRTGPPGEFLRIGPPPPAMKAEGASDE